MSEGIGKAVELGTQNLEITETILGKIEIAFDLSQQKVAATFVKCGLLSKMEVEETKAVQKAAEATPKKKETPAEKKPASPLQQRRGARRGAPPAAAAVVAPSSASRGAPRAAARKTRAGGGAPVAVAGRAPAAAAAVNIMSKASPSTAAQTFGHLMSTLLSLKHDDWSKKVDGLLHGVRYGPCLATPFTAPRPHHPHCPHYPHCPHSPHRPSDQPTPHRLRRSSSTSSAPTRWTRWRRPSRGCSRACSR